MHSDEFVPYAPEDVGAQVKVNHADCPSGVDRKQRLFVKRVHSGVIAYCHHCGLKGAAFRGGGERVWTELEDAPVSRENVRTAHEALKYEDAVRWVEYYNATFGSEDEFETVWSHHPQVWIRSKGFKTPHDAGVIYGAPDGETPGLILPIRASDGRVVGVQIRRDFSKHRALRPGPKYETKLMEKAEPFIYGSEIVDTLVMVEDYLSAMRVRGLGRVGLGAIPLYGNTCADSVLASVLEREPVQHLIVWLDNDKPEIMEAATDIAVRAEPLFDLITVVCDWSEPTKHSDDQLRLILGV